MSDVINLVQGDTRPIITLALTHPDGSAFDVSQASGIKVYMRQQGSTTLVSTITCSPVTTGADGKVWFDFSNGALATLASGLYEGEIEVTIGSAKQTVYDPLKFRVRAQFA